MDNQLNNYVYSKTIKSAYKYVSVYVSTKTGHTLWRAHITTKNGQNGKYFETEREAAIAVDKGFINIGKYPVNILKRK